MKTMKFKKLLSLFVICMTAFTVSACGSGLAGGGEALASGGSLNEKAEALMPDDGGAGALYTIICRNESGDPVEGVTLQLCTDLSCNQAVTNRVGMASFAADPGEYEIGIQDVPEGYSAKGYTVNGNPAEDEIGFKTEDGRSNYTIVIYEAKAASEDGDSVSAGEDNAGSEDVNAGEMKTGEEKTDASAPSDTDKRKRYTEMKYLDGIDLEGVKTIMVNYWEPWCPYCVEEMPDLEKLYQKYKDEGLLIVGMYEETEGAEDALKKTGVTYPIVHIPQTSMYTAQGYPETVFVDEDGNLIEPVDLFEGWADEYGYSGAAGYEYWEPVVEAMLKHE